MFLPGLFCSFFKSMLIYFTSAFRLFFSFDVLMKDISQLVKLDPIHLPVVQGEEGTYGEEPKANIFPLIL